MLKAVLRTVLFAVAIICTFTTSHGQPSDRSLNPEEALFRVKTNLSGEHFVEIKWAIGTTNNIQVIRIPWGYRSLLLGPSQGSQLVDNGHVESIENGHALTFAYSAILPDFSMHSERDSDAVANNRSGDVAQGLVQSGVNKKYPVWDERRAFLVSASVAKNSVYWGPQRSSVSTIAKQSRFGLNRIGPDRFVVEPWRLTAKIAGPIYNDVWFDGLSLEESSAALVCGSDENFVGKPDPDNSPNFECVHYFTVEKISALAQIRYRKKYLSQWREIQDKAKATLSSFLNRSN